MKRSRKTLKIEKNVVIETNGFKIYVDSLNKKGNDKILNINGKIKGNNGVYSFQKEIKEYITQRVKF